MSIIQYLEDGRTGNQPIIHESLHGTAGGYTDRKTEIRGKIDRAEDLQ